MGEEHAGWLVFFVIVSASWFLFPGSLLGYCTVVVQPGELQPTYSPDKTLTPFLIPDHGRSLSLPDRFPRYCSCH